MAYDSMETWRLYSAEGSVKQCMTPNVGVAQQIAREVMSSSWWRMLPYRPNVRFEIDDHVDSDGMTKSSIGSEDGELLPTSWLFRLHVARATERTILHELAHVAAARLLRNADGSIGLATGHGPWFAGPYVEMLKRFSRREDPEPLFEAMADFEVQVPGPAEWRERQVVSLELERAVLAGDEPEPDRKPPSLGSILARSRKERGWTQAELARRVSASVASIRRIESSIRVPRATADTAVPSAASDRAVALRAAVLLGADPIQLVHVHGFKLEYGEQFEQLRALNPGWTALVEQLNDLSARRASWWEADQR